MLFILNNVQIYTPLDPSKFASQLSCFWHSKACFLRSFQKTNDIPQTSILRVTDTWWNTFCLNCQCLDSAMTWVTKYSVWNCNSATVSSLASLKHRPDGYTQIEYSHFQIAIKSIDPQNNLGQRKCFRELDIQNLQCLF